MAEADPHGRHAGAGGDAHHGEPHEAAQSIMEDAVRGGPGTRLDLTLPASAGDAALAAVRRQFASLVGRGLDVRVARAGARAGRTFAAA